jgi:preprotein translocase subunit SecA
LLDEIPSSLTQQRERLLDLVDGIVGAVVEESCPPNKPPEDWDWKGIRAAFVEHFGIKPKDYEHLHDLSDLAHELYKQAFVVVEEREKEMGSELLMRVFRHFYLEEIDKQWVEHLTNMEHLRDGIGLRGYGQRDPKQEYKKEGYDIFVTMMAAVSSNVLTKVMKVRLQKESEIERMEREDYERHQRQASQMQMRHGGEVAGGGEGEESASRPPPPKPQVRVAPVKRETPKISRNDLCPCGSGEKFKKCHGAALEDEEGGDDATA